jgi:LacI family transcriptional regulator
MAAPGKRNFATIRDVARIAGVSIATVSATVNGTAFVSPALRARVLKAVDETGYAPDGVARSLKRGVAPLIGLIVSDVTIPFFAALARAAETAAHARGYTILMGNTDEDPATERRYLEIMRAQRVAGIILAIAGAGDGAAEADNLGFLRASVAVPTVLIDRSVAGWDSVAADHVGSAALATAHLASLGHRGIGFIAGTVRLSTNRERLEGYRRALAAAGLRYDPALVRLENKHGEQAYDAALDLLGATARPSAVVPANIKVAIATMRAAAALGLRCPRDLSVTGIDDFPWPELMQPQPTVVAQPAERIGAEAVRLVLERLAAHDAPPRALVLPGELVVRASSAPPSL